MSVIPTVEAEIANYFWRNQSTVARIGNISNSYIGLCTGAPGESGASTANEITTLGNRQSLGDTIWNLPSNNVITYNVAVNWSPTGSGTVSHWILSTTPTLSTTHDFWAAFPATVNYQSGDPLRFRDGSHTSGLRLTVDDLFSYYEGSILLRNLIGGYSSSNTSAVYFALSTTAPNPDGTNVTEPTIGAYARTGVYNLTTSFFGAPTGSSPTSCANITQVNWPEATDSWGFITHWAAYDASTSGNMIYYGTLDNPQTITTGLRPVFGAGDLVFTID